ncbi:MAG TPA: hypothetical protein VJR58_12340 [Vineibacter sp.]|nr:hypothetical protein [Vineibacter sp.]
MAVGFEFATGWDIFKLKHGMNIPAGGLKNEVDLKACTESYPKAAVVRGGLGWKMTVDGTEIEYVVDEVAESKAGETQLTFVMADLKAFVRMMNARNVNRFVTAADFPKDTFRAPNDRFVIHIKNELRFKDVEAIPQVTGGVRLARVRKLWRLLADPKSQAAKQFFAETPGGTPIYSSMVNKVTLNWRAIKDSKWKDHAPSAKMRGLVTLIATYLLRGYSPEKHGVGAVKYLFVLMSRTKFSALFNDLPSEERNHYKTAQADWIDFICKDVMSQIAGMPPTGIDPDGLLIERRITDRGNLKAPVELPITRRAWLAGMLKDEDLLSAAAHPLGGDDDATWHDSNPELGHRLRGLAGLGDKMDAVQYGGRQNKAAIIEFRARQAALPYKVWDDYAFRMHRFFTEINEGERHGLIDLGAPALA